MEFVRFPTFEKSAAGLLSEADIFELEMQLVVRPDAGDLIPGGRGLRKLRRPAKGRGKRGGARVIYYHVVSQHLILLIVAYAKNEQEDLDADKRRALRELVAAMSQSVFARLINVGANTVESWEQGVRRPREATLKLLTIAKQHPERNPHLLRQKGWFRDQGTSTPARQRRARRCPGVAVLNALAPNDSTC